MVVEASPAKIAGGQSMARTVISPTSLWETFIIQSFCENQVAMHAE
jgi:hypothetical protein